MSIAYRIATVSKTGHGSLISRVSQTTTNHVNHSSRSRLMMGSIVRNGNHLAPRTTLTSMSRALSSYTNRSLFSRAFSTTFTPLNNTTATAATGVQEQEEPIQGSAPAYKRHLLICTGVKSKNWVKKPELSDPYLNLLSTAVRGQEVKVNWTEEGSDSVREDAPAPLPTKGPRHDLILFPDNVKFINVRAEAFQDLSRYLDQHPIGTLRPALEKQLQDTDGDALTTELVPGSGESVTIELVRVPSAVLVCIHGSRDCRCGERGGDMYTILKDMVQMTGLTNSVKIYGVSHIGGHKYAPNTIMYPSGDWHGNLSEMDSNDAQQLLFDALANGGVAAGVRERVADPIMIEKWRGRMGMNKQEQLKLYEKVLEKQRAKMVAPLSGEQKNEQPQSLFSAPGEDLYEDDGLKEQVNAVSIEANKPTPAPQTASAEEPKRVKIIFETFQKVRTEIDAKVGERIFDIVKDKDPSRHGVYQALECTCGGQLECATCHVYIEPPYSARLTPVTDAEEDMLEYAVGRKAEVSRLGCQIKIQPELEGMVVKLPQY
ncbi:hypothetical protein FBU30_001015 [Linnemannia zychae]|nr:hypothetical protein FBU30_001015 [Linnemannia zychae]